MLPLPHLGVAAVTGYDEATEVYRDPDTFSSCNSVVGPFATFPVPLEGDDISEIIARCRDQLPMHEHMVTMDPPPAAQGRADRPGDGHLPRREHPDVTAVVRTATFLFAAGQDTTARLLAAALKHLAEHPGLQDELRTDRERIPDFLDEVLRLEGPVKADLRLTRRSTSVSGVEVPAGTPVMLLNGAASRYVGHPGTLGMPANLKGLFHFCWLAE